MLLQQVSPRTIKISDELTYASMMALICIGDPAVTLEMVQQASFRMPSFGDDNRLRRAGRAPEAMMT